MKNILVLVLSLFALTASAQFRMVGSGSWSSTSDTTFSASITFFSDLTGGSFLANGIVDTMRVFTGTQQQYQVDSIVDPSFSSGTLHVKEISPTNGAPIGQIMVYTPTSTGKLPMVPFGSTGVTPQLQAAVITYNSNIDATGDGGVAIAYDALTSGTVTGMVTRLGGDAATISNPGAGIYTITLSEGSDYQRIFLFGNNTTLNASNEFVINVDNSANSEDPRILVQLFDGTNDTVVDQQATATTHTVTYSNNIATITIPGMNGFGANGFYVEIR